jgi:hypothetical protein
MAVDTIDAALSSYLPSASAAQRTIVKDAATATLAPQHHPRLPWLVANSFNPGEALTDAEVQSAAEAGAQFLMRSPAR